jgi:hypothetical protein
MIRCGPHKEGWMAAKTKADKGNKAAAAVREGELYKERNPKVKFPRIIKIRKIAQMGSLSYVFFVAENQAAQAIHPNGGFIPVESFLTLWEPVKH